MGKYGRAGTREYYRARYLAEREEYKRRAKARYRANPERMKDDALQRGYGISYEEYALRLRDQGGVCAICSGHEKTKRKGKVVALAVDHNHRTGKTRGIICRRCNSVLGFVDDNAVLLHALMTYLEKYGS